MTQSTPTPIVLVQPILADRQAYESGQKVGQVAVYVVMGIIALWLIGKLLRK
jgi:hypothetical protein